MTSTSASPRQLASPVRRAAVGLHTKLDTVRPALARLEALADELGVELVEGLDGEPPDLAVVLGGDGTMLRALAHYLGSGVPVIGVNFGRVGFLASIPADELESGLRRAFAGEAQVIELPTLAASAAGATHAAVNDVVAHSATLGRMVELAWEVGGEDFGTLACDGVICAAPSGSTAYNLSNGGPVLAWGLDAMAITFIAPHSLNARPLVDRPGDRGRRPQPQQRRAGRDSRRRPSGRRDRRGRRASRPHRRAAKLPRNAARGPLLPPLPRDLCFVASASRTSY